MSDMRRAFEKRLEKFIPKLEDEIFRKRVIKEYALSFSEDEIPDILNEKKPLYLDVKKCEWVYLPK